MSSPKEVSAFAIYSKKRKSTDSTSPVSSLKKNKNQLSKSSSNLKKLQNPSEKMKKIPSLKKIPAKITNNSSIDSSNESTDDAILNSINPIDETSNLFKWLIHPLSPTKFFKENWEKAPLHIQREKKNYYKVLMSTPIIDDILKKFNVLYSKNIDITSYTNGIRETHNPLGRAHSSVVWDYYSNGCSIRMLNPQTFIPKIYTLNSTLQEYFHCFVGANFYLTPPGSQGFAPHYDDIEAFILQIEGKKRWRLYKPRNDAEYLPRFSSENLKESEIGEPILDVVVKAGDILYFPRGTIHQGETLEDSHSLHVTLSVYQRNSWGDFLHKLVPTALNAAIANNFQLRRGLPLYYLNHIGSVHAEEASEFREKFLKMTKEMLQKVIDEIDVDAAADQIAKDQIHDCLPPALAPAELKCSVLENGEKMVEEGVVVSRVEIEPDTKIRLARAHCVRLVREDDKDSYKLYYSCENSKEYHEYELQFLEVDANYVPAIKKIIQVYPEFIKVDDLPIDGEDNRVQVARDLWEKSIVLTDVPLLEVE